MLGDRRWSEGERYYGFAVALLTYCQIAAEI